MVSFGLLKVAVRRAEFEVDKELQSKLGIDLSIAEVLFCFLREPIGASVSPSKIASMLTLPPTTVTSRLRRLEGLGLVVRETTPVDRRALNAQLTEDGERTLIEAANVYADVINRTFDPSEVTASLPINEG